MIVKPGLFSSPRILSRTSCQNDRIGSHTSYVYYVGGCIRIAKQPDRSSRSYKLTSNTSTPLSSWHQGYNFEYARRISWPSCRAALICTSSPLPIPGQ